MALSLKKTNQLKALQAKKAQVDAALDNYKKAKDLDSASAKHIADEAGQLTTIKTHSDNIEKFKTENTQFLNAIEKLKKSPEQIEQEYKALSEKVSALKTKKLELEDAQIDMDDYSTEIEQLTKAKKEFETPIQEARAQLKSASPELNKKSVTPEQLNEYLKRLQDEENKITQELQTLVVKQRPWKKNATLLERVTKDFDAAEKQLKEFNKEEKLKKAKEDLDKSIKDQKELQDKLKKEEAAHKEANEKLVIITAEKNKVEAQKNAATALKTKLDNEEKSLAAAEDADFDEKLKIYQKNIADAAKDIDDQKTKDDFKTLEQETKSIADSLDTKIERVDAYIDFESQVAKMGKGPIAKRKDKSNLSEAEKQETEKRFNSFLADFQRNRKYNSDGLDIKYSSGGMMDSSPASLSCNNKDVESAVCAIDIAGMMGWKSIEICSQNEQRERCGNAAQREAMAKQALRMGMEVSFDAGCNEKSDNAWRTIFKTKAALPAGKDRHADLYLAFKDNAGLDVKMVSALRVKMLSALNENQLVKAAEDISKSSEDDSTKKQFFADLFLACQSQKMDAIQMGAFIKKLDETSIDEKYKTQFITACLTSSKFGWMNSSKIKAFGDTLNDLQGETQKAVVSALEKTDPKLARSFNNLKTNTAGNTAKAG